jgi:hypothetical protein
VFATLLAELLAVLGRLPVRDPRCATTGSPATPGPAAGAVLSACRAARHLRRHRRRRRAARTATGVQRALSGDVSAEPGMILCLDSGNTRA